MALLTLCVVGCDLIEIEPLEPETPGLPALVEPTAADLNALRASSGCSVVNSATIRSSFNGDISDSQCNLIDSDRRADYFGIRIEGSESATVSMQSQVVDSYLVFYNKDGQVLRVADDTGGGTDAELSYSLRDGVYLVAATTRRPEERGQYQLTFRRTTQ